MKRLLRTIRRFLSELRRRNVYQVAVTYVLVGVFVIEAADLTLTRLGLPPWTVTLVIVLVGLGSPIALVMAWALEMTPEGVRVEEAAAEETDGSEIVSAPAGTTRDVWVGASVLAVVLLGVWWMWGGPGGGSATTEAASKTPNPQEHSIAVLPFEVTGSGAEEWRDGMVTALSMTLDGAAGLRAISQQRIFAAAQQVDSTERGAMERPGLALARTVGAQYAVIGRAVQIGGELRLGAEIRETATGERLGQPEVRGPPDRAMALADQLTRKVLGVLLERSDEAIPSVKLASLTTESLPALKSFLKGERRFRAGQYEAAVQDFTAAIRRDSSFALAYARLAQAQWGAASPKMRVAQNWHRARTRSDRLPSRTRRLVRAVDLWFTGSVVAAADSLRQLTAAYPDDPAIWYAFGEVLLHSSIPGGFPEADRAFRRAVDLDPGHAGYYGHLVQMAFMFHRDRSLATQRIAAQPETRGKTLFQLAHDLVFGSPEERRQVLARLDTMAIAFEGSPFVPLVGATLHPADGALQERVLRTILERDDTKNTPYPPLLVGNSLERGQVAQAAADLRMVSNPTVATCLLARSSSLGTPVPDSVARAYLDPSGFSENASAGRLACAGIYLADQRRSADLDALLDRLRAKREQDKERAGVNEASVAGMIEELNTYRAWKNGWLDRATPLPPRSIFINPIGWWPLSWGGIWRGDLLRARGELQKAEGWYLGAWWHPVAHERLGQLYEKMGRPKKARAAYERFIAAWKNADPTLQPRVETARERLDALSDSLSNATATTE